MILFVFCFSLKILDRHHSRNRDQKTLRNENKKKNKRVKEQKKKITNRFLADIFQSVNFRLTLNHIRFFFFKLFRFNLSVTRKNAFVSTQAISNELFLLLIFWCFSLCEKKKERKRNRNTRSVSFCQMSSQFTLKHVFLTFNNLTRGFPLK